MIIDLYIDLNVAYLIESQTMISRTRIRNVIKHVMRVYKLLVLDQINQMISLHFG